MVYLYKSISGYDWIDIPIQIHGILTMSQSLKKIYRGGTHGAVNLLFQRYAFSWMLPNHLQQLSPKMIN